MRKVVYHIFEAPTPFFEYVLSTQAKEIAKKVTIVDIKNYMRNVHCNVNEHARSNTREVLRVRVY